MADIGHWTTDATIPKEWVGFVYLITSPTNKKYVGRKNRYVKKSKKESDWRSYKSSSKDLKADIKKQGKESFTFEILHFCTTLSELALEETKEILIHNAVYAPDYYNRYVYLRLINNKKT